MAVPIVARDVAAIVGALLVLTAAVSVVGHGTDSGALEMVQMLNEGHRL